MRLMQTMPRAERGVALAISLVLLVVLTILGVATLSGSRINEKITSNAQQKAIAFEGAESAINSVWSVNALLDAVRAIPESDYQAPPPIPQQAIGTELSADLAQTSGADTTVNIAANVSVQFCGEDTRTLGTTLTAEEGGPVQLVQWLVNVNGVATIANSRTRADHVQRGSITGPRTDRQSVCVAPGIQRASATAGGE